MMNEERELTHATNIQGKRKKFYRMCQLDINFVPAPRQPENVLSLDLTIYDQNIRALLIYVDEDRFPDVVDLWYHTFQIECLGKDNLEDLLHVDGRGCGAENE